MGNVGDQQQDYDENGESPMRAGDQEENMGQFDGNDMEEGSPDQMQQDMQDEEMSPSPQRMDDEESPEREN